MARPQRKKLKFDEDSVNALLMEIYNDTHNIRAKIVRLFTKWEQQVMDTGEIAAVGGEIVKLIQAETKNQEQKLMLLKFLKDVVFEKNKKEKEEENKDEEEMTTERRNALLDMVRKEVGKDK